MMRRAISGALAAGLIATAGLSGTAIAQTGDVATKTYD
jgi:hypothetical protein